MTAAAGEIRCRRCLDGYTVHEPDGGHCTAIKGGEVHPGDTVPCVCPGFVWVDPWGAPVGSYADPPQR
jgi:hypothetical protein